MARVVFGRRSIQISMSASSTVETAMISPMILWIWLPLDLQIMWTLKLLQINAPIFQIMEGKQAL